MRTALVRWNDLVASPWKNGGGMTREIAVQAAGGVVAGHSVSASLDDFAWRVSVADVAQPGPFSRFPGIDRTLVLLSGAGMTLVEEGGARHELRAPLDRLDFSGETPIFAQLPAGPTRDFNLMTRRSAVTASVTIVAARRGGEPITLRADTALLFCAAGTVTIELDGAHAATLGAYDTLRIDAIARELACVVSGDGALIAVNLSASAASGAASSL